MLKSKKHTGTALKKTLISENAKFERSYKGVLTSAHPMFNGGLDLMTDILPDSILLPEDKPLLDICYVRNLIIKPCFDIIRRIRELWHLFDWPLERYPKTIEEKNTHYRMLSTRIKYDFSDEGKWSSKNVNVKPFELKTEFTFKPYCKHKSKEKKGENIKNDYEDHPLSQLCTSLQFESFILNASHITQEALRRVCAAETYEIAKRAEVFVYAAQGELYKAEAIASKQDAKVGRNRRQQQSIKGQKPRTRNGLSPEERLKRNREIVLHFQEIKRRGSAMTVL